ncbi:MAG TPA: hypothetical protein VE263_08900 [Candidatus Angelobacter sp.]|nr:hypothetical protein [Candidatus Angelobacter sp.]
MRLSERSAARSVEPSAAEPVTETAKEANTPAEDPAQRKAEIASLEKQIKDKQQRVELLMRLFVADEKSFVKDPLNPSEEPTVQERRRYEQDELRFEAAEVARLRAKLDALKALPSQ